MAFLKIFTHLCIFYHKSPQSIPSFPSSQIIRDIDYPESQESMGTRVDLLHSVIERNLVELSGQAVGEELLGVNYSALARGQKDSVTELSGWCWLSKAVSLVQRADLWIIQTFG